MPVGIAVPELVCTPKELVTAFGLELGFDVGVGVGVGYGSGEGVGLQGETMENASDGVVSRSNPF